MTWRANKSRFPKKPLPKQRKNGSRTYIDPEAFILMRHRAFLKTEEAAELLDVNHRTLLNWEKGKSRIPYTAYRVLKLKVGYVFDDRHFGDWFVKGDTLWSPEGRGFKPEELRYIANYFWMARQWLAERMAAKPLNPRNFTITTGTASDVSPTINVSPHPPVGRARALPTAGAGVGTLTSCGVAPCREPWSGRDASFVRQEKTADFEKFLAKLGIPA